MDPVTPIVTALAAGAASAPQDTASAAVPGAYARPAARVHQRLAGRGGELVLARHEDAPSTREAPLSAELAVAGAGDDPDLVTGARTLMSLADEAGSRAGKYEVAVHDSQGVQIGDHNTQTNTFGPRA